MKKILGFVLMAAAFVLTACQTQQKKVSISDLQGAWFIVKVDGIDTPDSLKQDTYLNVDANLADVSGRSSCNLFNTTMTKDDSANDKFTLTEIATTMMSCPHLEFEQKVLSALNACVKVARGEDGVLLLLDESGSTRLELTTMNTSETKE
ncbi:META domain-containing protein [Porphyromonas sp.]|uniref:META domain-containing protein n=1 Tax=Porphyromonas sp. TaxID=1924944 RepID=UPI0026DAA7FF|nr:META domain-containing protein [Porphyromonas sp.]MDO4771571.1 META domain-containing protein [Porphyromonas sp.]